VAKREQLDLLGAVGATHKDDELERPPQREVDERPQLARTRLPRIGARVVEPDQGWTRSCSAASLNTPIVRAGSAGSPRFLIRDRDAKFTGPFDEVFRTEGIEVIRTPIRAPRANAYAERWVRSVRNECLDWTLILGRRHLERIPRAYVAHYNQRRPHRGLHLDVPVGDRVPAASVDPLAVHRRDILAGIIHEYEQAA
jgi:hypothetical protein